MKSDPIKVYDARWEASEFSDAEVARLFESTLVYGRSLGCDTLTLCRDARLASGHVMEIGIATAMRMGYRVFARLDAISTPQSYYTTLRVTQDHPGTMGLTITASHNPAAYIGIKFTVPVVQAIGWDCGPDGGLRKIREIYHGNETDTSRPGGSLEVLDLTQEFLDYSLAQAGVAKASLRGLKVVLDALNGSAGNEILLALKVAGVEVVSRRIVPDGNFPTGSPNPTSHGKMNAAIELARTVGAKVVLGVDGDGDRIVFGDAQGLLTAGFAFVPILRSCMARAEKGAAALYDPKVSPPALVEWAKLGARPVLFRNGHSQIKDYMRRVTAVAAAEESGHYYHRLPLGKHTIFAENSVVTILLFLKAIHGDAKALPSLRAMESGIHTTGEFNYQFASDKVRDEALSALAALLTGEGASTRSTSDDGIDLEGTCVWRGVHLAGTDLRLEANWYWGYLRVATNEKAVVRSYFSAGSRAEKDRVEKAARDLLSGRFAGRVID